MTAPFSNSQHVLGTMRAVWWITRQLMLGLGSGNRRPAKPEPHVLAIHSYFPPDQNTGSYRCAAVARHWSRHCGKYTVLTRALPVTSGPNWRQYDGSAGPGVAVEVIRCGGSRSMPQKKGYYFPYFFYRRVAPELPWAMVFAQEACARLADLPPDIVFASGPLFADFVAACWVASHFGSRLVLDYRDEWAVKTPAFIGLGWVSAWLERKCLAAADSVVFVTEGKRDAYRDAFPFLRERRCLVIPQGWDPEHHRDGAAVTGPSSKPDGGRHILSFVGNPTDAIPIGSFLLALGRVLARRADLAERLRLQLIGRRGTEVQRKALEAFSEASAETLVVHRPVPHSESVALMRQSDTLLLLNNVHYRGVTPLKFFDYMATGRPILVWGAEGDCARAVADAGAGIVVAEHDDRALEAALDAFGIGPPGHWDTPTRQEWRDGNTSETWITQMAYKLAACREAVG